MKARVAWAMIAAGVVCGAVAVTSYHWAILATLFAVLLGGTGLALLSEAIRTRPNPRTTSPEHVAWMEAMRDA